MCGESSREWFESNGNNKRQSGREVGHRGDRKRQMSLRMTVQMDWLHHASYSRYHPDNLNKLIAPLPEQVKGAPPLAKITSVDKTLHGAWGHSLCCEKAFGPCETTTRIKENITCVSRPRPHIL